MDSSTYLRMSVKGEGRFEWTGTFQDLDKFFAALGYTGTWSQPTGEGSPHKFSNRLFTCTWYATKKSLLIQGKRCSEVKDKLKKALENPVPLTGESETESVIREIVPPDKNAGSQCKSHSGTDVCVRSVPPEVQKGKKSDKAEIHNGLSPGRTITNLLEIKMKKWDWEGAKVTIVTPFIDKAGLIFIVSCMQHEISLDKIYTREVCAWNNKKIDWVFADAKMAKHWIVKKIVAFKKAPSFHAKFLAGEYKDKVELITTSCNITSEHLFSEQLETVMQIECSVETFHSDWLRPLEIKGEEEGNTAKFLNMDDILQEVQNIK